MTGKIIEIGDLECLETEPEPNKSGVVILIDRAQLKGGRNLFGEMVTITAADAPAGWKTTPAPQDGTYIIAVGRIIAEDEFGCSITPYIGEVRWQKTESGFAGWMYGGSQPLSVTCYPDEVFTIDWWLESPKVVLPPPVHQ